MISIKDRSVLWALLAHKYELKLSRIMMWLDSLYPDRIVITCGKRPGDKGVHGTDPCRGIDIRSWVFNSPQRIVDHINKTWVYDPMRPEKKCAILHDAGSGPHIHIQSHPNTTKRDELDRGFENG